MYCTRCGFQLSETARYCSQCGERAEAAGPQQAWRARRRLYRLNYDKKIAGVCSGLSRYLDVDVTLVRVIVVALTLVTGAFPGLLAYIIAMFIMPRDEGYPPMAAPRPAAAPPSEPVAQPPAM
jgi:phage shock protein C